MAVVAVTMGFGVFVCGNVKREIRLSLRKKRDVDKIGQVIGLTLNGALSQPNE